MLITGPFRLAFIIKILQFKLICFNLNFLRKNFTNFYTKGKKAFESLHTILYFVISFILLKIFIYIN